MANSIIPQVHRASCKCDKCRIDVAKAQEHLDDINRRIYRLDITNADLTIQLTKLQIKRRSKGQR